MPFVDVAKLKTGERLPGWKDQSFSSKSMTFAHFTFEAGSKIHEHCHLNEEVWTVIEGELEVTVGAESMIATPGVVAIVPPYTAHSVRAITDGKAIVADCPVRVDPSRGKRGVVEVLFEEPVPLPSSPAIQIPFTLRNWGKSRVVIGEIQIEIDFAAQLPAAVTTEIPSGELPTRYALEPEECRHETVTYAGPAPGPEQVFYVKGAVFYDDAFGGRQHCTFCRVYDQKAFVDPGRPGYNYGS